MRHGCQVPMSLQHFVRETVLSLDNPEERVVLTRKSNGFADGGIMQDQQSMQFLPHHTTTATRLIHSGGAKS